MLNSGEGMEKVNIQKKKQCKCKHPSIYNPYLSDSHCIKCGGDIISNARQTLGISGDTNGGEGMAEIDRRKGYIGELHGILEAKIEVLARIVKKLAKDTAHD